MRVLLFGLIAEHAGADTVTVEAPTTDALRRTLEQRIPGLDRMSYALAVDRTVVPGDRALRGDEEVALLPPFAGG